MRNADEQQTRTETDSLVVSPPYVAKHKLTEKTCTAFSGLKYCSQLIGAYNGLVVD